MKKLLIVVLGVLLFTSLYAEKATNISSDEKIDSIYVLQKKMYKDVKDQPLENKKYGVEFNFLRLLFFGSNIDYLNHSLSGTFSLFFPKKKVEIAFPFFYSNPTVKWDDDYIEESSLRQITLDCHYRKFLGNSLNKFYIAGFIRYANLKGYEGEGWFDGKARDYKLSTENKIGIGISIGYRVFSYSGFYWGGSLNVGKYFIGKNNKFRDQTLLDNDGEIIYNMEFFKFGYAF